ncbi:MAG: hypothetical protein ACR2LX_03610 [Jatrophihabitans sp.]
MTSIHSTSSSRRWLILVLVGVCASAAVFTLWAASGSPSVASPPHAAGPTVTVTRTVYADGGTTYANGGTTYANGGKTYQNGGRTYANGGTTYANGGRTYVNGGKTYENGGRTYVNGGTTYVNGGRTYVNGGKTYVNGGKTYVNGGKTYVNGGTTYASISVVTSTDDVTRSVHAAAAKAKGNGMPSTTRLAVAAFGVAVTSVAGFGFFLLRRRGSHLG